MTEEEKQKLNEKLARWAGFTFEKQGSGKKISELYGWDVIDESTFVHYPDGGSGLLEDMPSFTDSLDACFKWLVPKLGTTLIGVDFIPPYRKQGEWLCNVEFEKVYMGRFIIESYRAKGETSALALCRAIEKLIDNKD